MIIATKTPSMTMPMTDSMAATQAAGVHAPMTKEQGLREEKQRQAKGYPAEVLQARVLLWLHGCA
jgi:hypothetical protein